MRRRALLVALLVAAVVAEDDDVDRTDFSDPALSEDKVVSATGPHSEVEPAWILPDCPDGKVPVGGSTDMVVALYNSGASMFNVSHIEAELLTPAGKSVAKLDRYEYGQPLGPREQRSFRYPMPISAEMPLGEYLLVASAYYNSRDKSPFVSLVCNETAELVPPLPDKDAHLQMLQMGVGGAVAVLVLVLLGRLLLGGSSGVKAAKAEKKKSNGGSTVDSNEWLSGTVSVAPAARAPRALPRAARLQCVLTPPRARPRSWRAWSQRLPRRRSTSRHLGSEEGARAAPAPEDERAAESG